MSSCSGRLAVEREDSMVHFCQYACFFIQTICDDFDEHPRRCHRLM